MNSKVEQPKIISGIYKGRKLKVANSTRPFTTRVKTVLFDTIANLIPNSSILDLFAGSGGLGFEALSRGAKLAILVENNPEAFENLKDNAKNLGLDKISHKIFFQDYIDFLKKHTGRFNIIFIDPPFPLQKRVKLNLLNDFLDKEGLIIFKIEASNRDQITIPDFVELVLEKKVGINTLLFLKRIEQVD